MEDAPSANATTSPEITRSTSIWTSPSNINHSIALNVFLSRLNVTLEAAERAALAAHAAELQSTSEVPSTNTSEQDTPENSHPAPNSTLQSYNLFCATCHPSDKERTPNKDPSPLCGIGTLLHTRAISTDRSVWLAKSHGAQKSVVPLEEQYFANRRVDGLQVNVFRPCECERQGIGCSTCGSPLGTRTFFCCTAPVKTARSETRPYQPEYVRVVAFDPTGHYHLYPMLSPSEAHTLTNAPETRSLSEIANMYPQGMNPRTINNVNWTAVYMFFADAVISTPAVVLSLPLNENVPPTETPTPGSETGQLPIPSRQLSSLISRIALNYRQPSSSSTARDSETEPEQLPVPPPRTPNQPSSLLSRMARRGRPIVRHNT